MTRKFFSSNSKKSERMVRSGIMPSTFVGSISAYMPHSVTPDTWASNSMPILSCMNSTSLYLTEARSASVAMISRSDECTLIAS